MNADEAKRVHPMRFAMDRLFAVGAPYKPSEILAVLVVVRAMAFDPKTAEFSSFLSYNTIAARAKLGRSTVQAALIHHCDKSRAPLLAKSFRKETRGYRHQSYRWTLVTAPELFAVKRDALQPRAKRRVTGAAAQQQGKAARIARIAVADTAKGPRVVNEGRTVAASSYKTYRCDCGELVTAYADGRCLDYITDGTHVCARESQISDTSDRQTLATNTSDSEHAVAGSSE